MFSQLTEFLCGPFFYPVYFASLLHAFDFFLYSAVPEPTQYQPQSRFIPRRANDSVLQPTGNHKEKKQNV
jgi:hypothetical protein